MTLINRMHEVLPSMAASVPPALSDSGTLNSYALTIRTSRAFGSVDVPKAIPDLGSTTSTLTIAGIPAADVIADLDMTLTINHPNSNNLRSFLVGPDGTRVELSTNNPGIVAANAYTNTTFDDSAPTAITAAVAPFTGRFRPEVPAGVPPGAGGLSAFNGKAANGVWTLELFDDASAVPPDVGSLISWSLKVVTATDAGRLPVLIPDLGTASSAVLVTGLAPGRFLGDVDVTVNIQHPRARSLDLFLAAPDGTRIELSSDNGGTSAAGYVNAVFNDQATASIVGAAAPFTGQFRPEIPLSLLNVLRTEAALGLWRLEVSDDASDLAPALPDSGVLVSWSLTLRTTTVTTTVDEGNPS